MVRLLEHWRRVRPSSLQKGTVGVLEDHPNISGRSSMVGLLEHWHQAQPCLLQIDYLGRCVSRVVFDSRCLMSH